MLVAPAFTYYFLSSDRSNDGELYAQLGLRWSGLINATLLPLLLTIILFLGPLTMQFFSGVWKLYSGKYLLQNYNFFVIWQNNCNLKWKKNFAFIMFPFEIITKSLIYAITLEWIGHRFYNMQWLFHICFSDPLYWISSWRDLVWVRNHVVAPLSEEWVFRACMMPLLLQCLSPITAVFVGPLLFGIGMYDLVLFCC